MDLGVFLKETKEQYIDLLISSGLANANQRDLIYHKLDMLHDGAIVQDSELGRGVAEVVINQQSQLPQILISANRAKDVNNIMQTNDEALDRLRMTIFHELTHVLQFNDKFSKSEVGFQQSFGESSNSLNEIAAQQVENIVMVQYYKDVRGLANAGIKTGQISLHGKRFRASGAVKDVSTNEAFHASTYYKESSLMEDILKSQGLSLNDLAKASFDFNKGQQQIFKEKIPNIASVCYNLETLTVYDRQLEGETVVTDAEFNEAISALMAQAQPQVASQQTQPQQPAQQTQQQTQSQQQPMPDEKPQYNEYL